MANEEERLVVLVEARVADLERNMRKASGTTGREFGKMRRDSKSATRQMEDDMVRSTSRINVALASTGRQIGALGKTMAGGFVAGIAAGGIAGLIGQFRQVAQSVAQIGDEARRAGVATDVFQEWKFVAEQNRIGIDSMVDGLKELNLRADEFVQTGSGPAAEAFQRLGYGAEDLEKKLKNPSELMLEIIDRLGKMDKAAQIRIADEIFGGSAGERFVELLEQGEEGIRRTIDEAHELGAVIEDEVIEKAAELDRRFNQVATTVGTALKTAIVESAEALQNFINAFQGMWERYEQQRRASEAGTAIGSMANPSAPEPIRSGARTTAKTGRLPEEEWVPPTPPPGGFGSTRSGGGRRDAAADRYKRERDAVRELIVELEEELSLVNATDQAKRAAEAGRRAGASATDDERREIVRLNEAIYQEKAALEAAEQAREEFNDGVDRLSSDAVDALGNVIAGTEDAADAFKKLAIEIVKSAVTGKGAYSDLFASLGRGGGGGGGGGFLGSLLGGFGNALPGSQWQIAANGGVGLYSSGTANTGGMRGEARGIVHGQEAVIPLPSGGKVPVQMQGAAGGGEAPINITYAPSYNVQGSGPEIAALKAQMAKDKAEFPFRVQRAVAEGRATRAIR